MLTSQTMPHDAPVGVDCDPFSTFHNSHDSLFCPSSSRLRQARAILVWIGLGSGRQILLAANKRTVDALAKSHVAICFVPHFAQRLIGCNAFSFTN